MTAASWPTPDAALSRINLPFNLDVVGEKAGSENAVEIPVSLRCRQPYILLFSRARTRSNSRVRIVVPTACLGPPGPDNCNRFTKATLLLAAQSTDAATAKTVRLDDATPDRRRHPRLQPDRAVVTPYARASEPRRPPHPEAHNTTASSSASFDTAPCSFRSLNVMPRAI